MRDECPERAQRPGLLRILVHRGQGLRASHKAHKGHLLTIRLLLNKPRPILVEALDHGRETAGSNYFPHRPVKKMGFNLSTELSQGPKERLAPGEEGRDAARSSGSFLVAEPSVLCVGTKLEATHYSPQHALQRLCPCE